MATSVAAHNEGERERVMKERERKEGAGGRTDGRKGGLLSSRFNWWLLGGRLTEGDRVECGGEVGSGGQWEAVVQSRLFKYKHGALCDLFSFCIQPTELEEMFPESFQ